MKVAHRVMEFHDAVGNHETQAGRQLGSEELLLREPQRWASREGVALVHVLPVERNGSYMRKEGAIKGPGWAQEFCVQ